MKKEHEEVVWLIGEQREGCLMILDQGAHEKRFCEVASAMTKDPSPLVEWSADRETSGFEGWRLTEDGLRELSRIRQDSSLDCRDRMAAMNRKTAPSA